MLYLDLRKAFDSVPHNELLFRLGLTGNLWSWFKAYLSKRQYCVRYKNSTSTTLKILSGVPQGSILGPYIDIPTSINHSRIYSFADDTKILKSIKCDTDGIFFLEILFLTGVQTGRLIRTILKRYICVSP